jgi:hypothetical protein
VASLGDLGFDVDGDLSATFLAQKGPHPPLGLPLHAALDDEHHNQPDDEVVLVVDDDDGVTEDGTPTSSGSRLQPQSAVHPEAEESDNYVLPNVRRPSARPCVQVASFFGVCRSVAGPSWLACNPRKQCEPFFSALPF